MSFRGGGGGGGIASRIAGLGVNFVVLLMVVGLIAGGTAAAATAFFLLHSAGAGTGYVVAGLPEFGHAFQGAEVEMQRYMKAHGTKPTSSTKSSTGVQPAPLLHP